MKEIDYTRFYLKSHYSNIDRNLLVRKLVIKMNYVEILPLNVISKCT